MTLFYSVIPGDAIIVKIGQHLDGAGVVRNIRHERLACSDRVWWVPGTQEPEE